MLNDTAATPVLPANTASSVAAQVTPKEIRLPRGDQELILVVDDEEAIRNVARRMLRDPATVFSWHATERKPSPSTPRQEEIALVLTDMSMPIMDGAALIACLEAMNPQVRIIRASGLLSALEATNVGVGSQYFIPKPSRRPQCSGPCRKH